mmetsp:Transcript_6791/g.12603  ORF Transcript_6791/g.12603 Transcript_6791/m.12603 type:complete len:604 (-) Transcript_6791:158-1969(-)|eukprot:CAMPEP_0167803012 /NCGR_PEP_ID=MMETSP0111_2-20121227/19514_1 /TAXON_ID=91324 /ORGANISM="Lotharella globosa, Strain CCCM811" /LENGTH=603 /DNA_ID=CAMNT_0007699263 /DNA_START=63 /DNA_END=1874 /DNA_ORIENTATION=-
MSKSVPPPPPPRVMPPSSPRRSTLKKSDSPLSAPEEAYFSKFNLRKIVAGSSTRKQIDQQVEHFFKAMYSSERSKWQYILEHYIMLDLITRKDIQKAFLDSSSWQLWLIPCLARTTSSSVSHANIHADKQQESMHIRDEQALFAITINMFEVLFFYQLVNNESKGAMQDLLVSSLEMLKQECGWGIEVRMVASVLLISFLKKVGNSARCFKRSLQEPCWTNLQEALDVFCDFFFYWPCVGATGGQKTNSPRSRSSSGRGRGRPPAIHLDASGCGDVAIVQQVVVLLNKDIKIHLMKNRGGFGPDKNVQKQEKKLTEHFEMELEFYTHLLMYFKRVNSVAMSATKGRNTGERDMSYKQSLAVLDSESKKLVRLLERRDKNLNKPKLKEFLAGVLDTILSLKKGQKAHKLGEIAQNLYYGKKVETVEWKEFGKMTVKLSNLATGTRKSIKEYLGGSKEANAGGGVGRSQRAPSGGGGGGVCNIGRSLAKRKEENKRYILTDLFWYGSDLLRVQLFVPHLTEQSKVKLLLDQAKRMICVKIMIEEEKDKLSKRRSARQTAKKYVQRETKMGLLQKFVKMPENVDLTKQPSLRLQPNSVTLTFHRKK